MSQFEFAYDIKLFAVVRVAVEADTRAVAQLLAERAIAKCIDCVDLSQAEIDTLNTELGRAAITITEASVSDDDEDNPYLSEVLRDGVAIELDGDNVT